MSRVYFIKPIDMIGPIKIGCSVSPTRRRDSLALWSPFPLEIVAEYVGGLTVERQFHALFASDHVHHEWFAWSPRLQAVIDAVAAGTFDGSSLPAPERLPRKAKDLGYLTDGWRYGRSVDIRLAKLRDHGLPWSVISRADISTWSLRELGASDLAVERERIEPILANLSAQLHGAPPADEQAAA